MAMTIGEVGLCRIVDGCEASKKMTWDQNLKPDNDVNEIRWIIGVAHQIYYSNIFHHNLKNLQDSDNMGSNPVITVLEILCLRLHRIGQTENIRVNGDPVQTFCTACRTNSQADQENSTLNILLGIESVKTIQSPALQNNPAQQTCLTTDASGWVATQNLGKTETTKTEKLEEGFLTRHIRQHSRFD